MEQTSPEDNTATYKEFINELEEECLFHQEGNLENHRYRMAQLALSSVKNSNVKFTVADFVDGTDIAKDAIAQQLNQLNEINKLDEVMETLRVVARHTQLRAAHSNDKEATLYVESLLETVRKISISDVQRKL